LSILGIVADFNPEVITFEGKQVLADKNGDVVRENDDNEKIEPEVENCESSSSPSASPFPSFPSPSSPSSSEDRLMTLTNNPVDLSAWKDGKRS
jgi:hypothetical protein